MKNVLKETLLYVKLVKEVISFTIICVIKFALTDSEQIESLGLVLNLLSSHGIGYTHQELHAKHIAVLSYKKIGIVLALLIVSDTEIVVKI